MSVLHQFLKEGRQLVSHLLVALKAGMPVGAVAEGAVHGGEIEAIDLLVASLVGFLSHFVQNPLADVEHLTVQHRAAEEHHFGLGTAFAHLRQTDSDYTDSSSISLVHLCGNGESLFQTSSRR